MTVRREQYFTYLLLGVFSLIALVPVVGIIITAKVTSKADSIPTG